MRIWLEADVREYRTSAGMMEFRSPRRANWKKLAGGKAVRPIENDKLVWYKGLYEEPLQENLVGSGSAGSDKCVMCYQYVVVRDITAESDKVRKAMAKGVVAVGSTGAKLVTTAVTGTPGAGKAAGTATRFFGTMLVEHLSGLVKKKRMELRAVICADGMRLVGAYNTPLGHDVTHGDPDMIWDIYNYGTWVHSSPGGKTDIITNGVYEATSSGQ